jgi:hypothetical protein
MGGARVAVVRAEHEIGAGEGGVDVSEGLVDPPEDVAGLAGPLVDGRQARVEGVVGAEDGRERLVDDAHPP